jgi:hypothetical protein
LSDKQIVIDGKKQRGVSPATRGNRGLYLLNVWVSENRFCIAQKRVEDKSNEITAIPAAPDSIDITDAAVTTAVISYRYVIPMGFTFAQHSLKFLTFNYSKLLFVQRDLDAYAVTGIGGWERGAGN